MPIKVAVEQTGLERSIQNGAKKAGRNLKINLGSSAKSIDALSQPLGRITGKADEFGKSMEAANARVLAFGASVGILNTVIQSFKQLVTTTIEVEKNLAKINSILNTNAAGLSKLSSDIFNIARATEQTFDTVSEAALELSRQGLSATEVTKRLNDSLILARLSGVSAADAVSNLTSAVNGFSKSGLTTSEILNKVSAAANKFAVSERDLFEGFKRSASVAQQAGVSLDELGGLITALQQKTARGGAVIGNSLKTIFTRIGKAESLDVLRDIGVEITDLQGNILPATKLLENFAKRFKDISPELQRSSSFKIGGGFQIAPLLAALDDYGDKNSIAIKATQEFANATDEAYKKNAVLSQTLSASINSLVLDMKELAAVLGEIGVTDTLRNVLDFFSNLATNIREILQGDTIGGTFARGIVKGISDVLTGPGLAIFALIVGKLAKDLLVFGTKSVSTFLVGFTKVNQKAQETKNIQEQIVQTLLTDKSVRDEVLKIQKRSKNEEEAKLNTIKYFNTALQEQLGLYAKIKSIGVGAAPGVLDFSRRISDGPRVTSTKAAGGFLPIGAENSDISKGVGGAPKSAKSVVIPNFSFGGGKKGTMVANSSEYIVPNYAGGGSAIFNQDMVRSMGLPSGAKKINASGGYVPNFAHTLGVNKDSIAIRSVTSPLDAKFNRKRGTGAVKNAIKDAILKAKNKNFSKITADIISDSSLGAFRKYFGVAKKGKNTWDVSQFNNAAKGFIPNFARGIYDSDYLAGTAKKQVLDSVLAAKGRKDVLVGPAGSGKTTLAKKGGGSIIKSQRQVSKFNEFLILSAAAKAKNSTFSAPFQRILEASKASGGNIQYAYVPNDELDKRRLNRAETGSDDLRDQKGLARTSYAPKNQQAFMRGLGRQGASFTRNYAEGYIPNFAAVPPAFTQFLRSEIPEAFTAAGNYSSAGASKKLGVLSSEAELRKVYASSPLRTKFDSLSADDRFAINKQTNQRLGTNRKAGQQGKYGVIYPDAIGNANPVDISVGKSNGVEYSAKAIPVKTQVPNKIFKDLRGKIIDSATEFVSQIGFQKKFFSDNDFRKRVGSNLNVGSVDAAFGTAFDAGFQGAIGNKTTNNATWDLQDQGTISSLYQKLSGDSPLQQSKAASSSLKAADFKNSLTDRNIQSILGKIVKSETPKSLPDAKGGKNAAGGYIPNFAIVKDDVNSINGVSKTVGQIEADNKGIVKFLNKKQDKATKLNPNPADPRSAFIQPKDKVTIPEIQIERLDNNYTKGLIRKKAEGEKQAKLAAEAFEKHVANKTGGDLNSVASLDLYNGPNSALDSIAKKIAVESKAGNFDDKKVQDKFLRFPIENFDRPVSNTHFTKFTKKEGDDVRWRDGIGLKLFAPSKEAKDFAAKAVKKKFGDKASNGYIPNFAMSAMQDAIEREKGAGVPVNQIRINQSGKLRNAGNPQGLAVTNTRDEPTGRIPNYANEPSAPLGGGFRAMDRRAKEAANELAKTLDLVNKKLLELQKEIDEGNRSFDEAGLEMKEFTANLGSSNKLISGKSVEKIGETAAGKLTKKSGKDEKERETSTGRFFALSAASFALQSAFGSVSDELSGFQKGLAVAAEGLSGVVSTFTLFEGLGVDVGGGIFDKFSKFADEGADGVKGVLGKFGKGLKAALPYVGQATIAFQAINTVSKALFDVDIAQEFGKWVGYIKTPAEEAAAALDKLNSSAIAAAARNGFKGGELKDFIKDINSILPDTSKLGKGRKKEGLKGDDFNEQLLIQGALGAVASLNLPAIFSGTRMDTGRTRDSITNTRLPNGQTLTETNKVRVFSPDIVGELGTEMAKKLAGEIVKGYSPQSAAKGYEIDNKILGGITPEQQDAQTRLALGFATLAGAETIEALNKAYATSDPKIITDTLVEGIEASGKSKEFIELSTKLAKGIALNPKELEEVNKATKKAGLLLEQEKAIKNIKASVLQIQIKTNLEAIKLLNFGKNQFDDQLRFKKESLNATKSEKFEIEKIERIYESIRKRGASSSSIFEKAIDSSDPIKSVLEGNAEENVGAGVADSIKKALTKATFDLSSGSKFEDVRDSVEKTLEGLKLTPTYIKEILDGVQAEIDGRTRIQIIQDAQNNKQIAYNEIIRTTNQSIESQQDLLKRNLDFDDKRAKLAIQQKRDSIEIAKAQRSSRSAQGPSLDDLIFGQREDAALAGLGRQEKRNDTFKKAREDFTSTAKSEGIYGNAEVVKALNSLGANGNQTEGNLERVAKIINDASAKERQAQRQQAEKLYAESQRILRLQGDIIIDENGIISKQSKLADYQKEIYNKLGNTLDGLVRFMATGSLQSSGDIEARISELKDNKPAFLQADRPLEVSQAYADSFREITRLTKELAVVKEAEKRAGLDGAVTTAKRVEAERNLAASQEALKKITEGLVSETEDLTEGFGVLEKSGLFDRGFINRLFNPPALPGLGGAPPPPLPPPTPPVVSTGTYFQDLQNADSSASTERLKSLVNFDPISAEVQKVQELQKAVSAAEIISAEETYRKNIKILGIKQELLNEASKYTDEQLKSGEADKLLLKYTEKIAAVQAETLSFRQKIQSKGIIPIKASENLQNALVDGAEQFVKTIAKGLADAIASGKSLGDVLRGAATDFLSLIAQTSLDNLTGSLFNALGSFGGSGSSATAAVTVASGGMITGGSGSKDDVPAMLMGGEYVMKKSSVSKYGPDFMEKLNNGSIQKFAQGGIVQSGQGGFYAPGTYGGTIKGKNDLLDFATQGYTSGENDVIGSYSSQYGGASVVNLEPESARLTNVGRTMGTPLQQATEEAKQQAFGIYTQQLELEARLKEEAEARKKAQKDAIVSGLIQLGVGFAGSALASGFAGGAQNVPASAATPAQIDAGQVTGGFINPDATTFGQRFVSGVKGSVGGFSIGDGSGTYGGLRNIGNSRRFISSRQGATAFQNNLTAPESGSAVPTTGGNTRTLADSYRSNSRAAAEAQLGATGFNPLPSDGGYNPKRSNFSTLDDYNQAVQNFEVNKSLKELLDPEDSLLPNFATGGSIPQTSGIDTVPAMLSGGEFIMNSAASDRIGKGNLERMNSGVLDPEKGSSSDQDLIVKLDELINATKESSGEVNITVNGSTGQEEESSSGGSSQKDTEFAKKLKVEVLKIIKDEKRLGGSLSGGKL